MKKILCLFLALFLVVSCFPMHVLATENEPIKILAIGNSFTSNSVTYIRQFADAGNVDIIVGAATIGGCSLETHWNNASNDKGAYSYSKKDNTQTLKSETDYKLSAALADEEWDYIVLQQVSQLSGIKDSYFPYISNLIEYIKGICPTAEFILNQTWAYEIDTNHSGFQNYDKNQLTMFNAIVDTYADLSDELGFNIFPCGEAFQIARAQYPFDYAYGGISLCKDDGYHASSYGCYILGAVWYEVLTGKSVWDNTFTVEGFSKTETDMLKKAAHNAVEKYYTISGTTQNPEQSVVDGGGFTLLNSCEDASDIKLSYASNAAVATGVSPDNICLSYTPTGTWVSNTINIDPSNLTTTPESVAFWIDLRNIGDTFGVKTLQLKNSSDAEDIITIRSGGDSKTATLISGIDKSVSIKTAANSNGTLLPAGFVGWVIFSLDNSTQIDYSKYDQIYIARSGYITADNTKNKTIYIDNIGYIQSVSGFLRHEFYKDGVLAPTDTQKYTYIGENISWDSVSNATKYIVNVYDIVNNKYEYKKSYSTTDTSISIDYTDSDNKYVVQVLASTDYGIVYTFTPERVKTSFRSNYLLLNDMSNESSVTMSGFTSSQITADSVFPDNKGIKTVIKKSADQTITFNFNTINPQDYEALVFYCKVVPASEESTGVSFWSVHKTGNRVDEDLVSSSKGVTFGVQTLNRDGTTVNGHIQSHGSKEGQWGIKVGYEGWVIMPINTTTITELNTLCINVSKWNWTNAATNAGNVVYFDNLAVVKNVADFIADTELYELGALIPSQNASTPDVTVNETTANVSFSAVDSATNYLINIYGANGYFASQRVYTNFAQILLPNCNTDYTVQVLSYNQKEQLNASDVISFTTNHNHVAEVSTPDCVNGGYTTYTCANCGDSYVADQTNALGHKYEEEIIAPTPESQGYTKHTCSVCGDTYNDNFVDYVPEEPSETPAGDFTYEVVGETVKITGYTGSDKVVIIPAEIEGKPVTEIGYRAFYTNRSITSVTLPATLTKVGDQAFRGCTALTEVALNEGLKTIGTFAFGATKLQKVVCPSTLETIGVSVFNGVTTLTDVDLANVKYIKGTAFAGCTNLGTTAAANRLLIPATVTEVAASAFQNCTGFTRIDWYPVRLSSGAAGNKDNPAFQGCTGLKTARIYQTAEYIPSYLFYKAANPTAKLGITTLSFMSGSVAKEIGDYAFFQARIGTVTFPDTLTKIGRESFRNVNALKTINFGTGVKSVGQQAFSNCNNLESVTIPGNVETLYAYAFRDCAALKTVVIEEGMNYISSYAFMGTALTSITLPASLTKINSGLTYGTSATINYYEGTYVDEYLHSAAAKIKNETLVPIA